MPRQTEVQRKVEVEGGGLNQQNPSPRSKTRPKRAKFGVIMFPQASNCALGGLWGLRRRMLSIACYPSYAPEGG